MKIEDLVCSFEFSEKLKELGVKQKSIFYWHWYKKNRDYEDIECDLHNKPMEEFDDGRYIGKCYSAFTAAELGKFIPPNHFNFYKNKSGYVFSINGAPNVYDENLASCMAKMLIYLLENKLMELPVND